MANQLPPSLADFGRRLEQAAEGQLEQERSNRSQQPPQTPPRRLHRRAVLGAVVAILVPAGAVAGATAVLSEDGAPLPGERDLPSDLQPAVDPGIRLDSAVPDPAGGLPWALKVFTNQDGLECAVVGRLRNGVLGQLRGTEFRPFPEGVPGACGDLSKEGLSVAVERRAEPQPRTVVYGLTAGREPVSITIAGEQRRVEPGPLGAYVLPLEGVLPLRGATVRTTVDGEARVRKLG